MLEKLFPPVTIRLAFTIFKQQFNLYSHGVGCRNVACGRVSTNKKKKDKLINVNLIVHYLVTANMKLSVSVLVISKALKIHSSKLHKQKR